MKDYRQERDCYLCLQEHGITEMEGFHVPEVIRWDDEFLVIEMTIVTMPFVLDFAQAYLDFPPEFSPEVWDDTLRLWRSRYGDDWPRVQRLLTALEELGVFYLDVHRGNVALV